VIERKVNRLPVVDDSGLVGIVTRADRASAGQLDDRREETRPASGMT
jgi:hypothetical protein